MNDTTAQKEVPPQVALAQKTVNLLVESMAAGHCAIIAQVTQLIQDVTSKADTISVGQLADLVSKDVTTMTRLLAVANTLGCNPGGSEVTTVEQAIQTIGFEKIRNIGVALLLLESAEKTGHGPEKKQVAAHSLASGVISQVILEHRGGANPEEAFVSGALRSYGQLLMVNFMFEEYKRARRLVPTLGWDQACVEVFGLTALDVGYEVLARSQMAKPLLRTLRPVAPELLKARSLSPVDLIAVVSEFAANFCESASGVEGGEVELAAHAQRLARRYGQTLLLGEAAFGEILERSRARLSSFGQAQGLRAFSSSLMTRLGAKHAAPPPERNTEVRQRSAAAAAAAGRTTQLSPGTPAPGASASSSSTASATPAATPASSAAITPAPTGASGKQVLTQFLTELDGGSRGRGLTLKEGLSKTLDLLHRELRLVQSVVFLYDDILSMWTARLGHGTLFDSIREQPLLSLEGRDLFTICLTRGEDVFIQAPDNPGIRKHVPNWLLSHVAGRSLLLLALKDNTRVYGVICGLGEGVESVSLSSQLAQPLRDVRTKLALLNRNEVSP